MQQWITNKNRPWNCGLERVQYLWKPQHISAGGTASERPPKGTVVKSGHMFLGGIGLQR